MLQLNDFILHHRADFFAYQTPRDYVLEVRYPQLFPTNVRPETLRQDARLRRRAAGSQAAQGGVSALYFPRAHPLSGERPRQRPLVSRSSGEDGRQAETGHHRHAALECRRVQPQRSLLRLQPFWRFRPASEQALPRYSPPGGAGARRLRGERQRRTHHRFLPSGGGRYPLLHRLAASSRATNSSASWAPVSAPVTPFSPPRSTAASASRRFNHASMSFGDVVWTGPEHPAHPGGLRRHWHDPSARCAMSGQPSAPPSTWTSSPLNPRKILLVHATYDLTFSAGVLPPGDR